MKTSNPPDLNSLVAAVKESKKYRDMNLPDAFLADLARQASLTAGKPHEIHAVFRKMLHNVIAPYLEDIDYKHEISRLENSPSILSDLPNYCLEVMRRHASTRERIPYLEKFFNTIFLEIGAPKSVLDLACALDPLCLPWIRLAEEATFTAYDVNGSRISYLQCLFELAFPFAKVIQQDIFIQPPAQHADCAFFFKEAHRLEKRQPGATARLIKALDVGVVVLSLPAMDLTRHHSLESYHTQLVEKAVRSSNKTCKKIKVEDEILFFIREGASR